MSDHEEHGTSLIYPLKKFFIGINEVYGYAAYIGYLLIVVTAILALAEVHGKIIARKWKLVLCAIDILLFIAYFICSIGHTGYIQTALCMFALPLFLLTSDKGIRTFFLSLSQNDFLCRLQLFSNGYLYVLAMGHSIASIRSI